MRNKLLGLAAILALGTTGGIAIQQTISNSVDTTQNTEDISTYAQPLPSNVDYTVTYDLPKNSQYLTAYVNIDGLAPGNDSLDRNYKLDLIETNKTTSVESTYTVTSFTTPSTVPTNAQYSTTATINHSFDFTTYNYSLELSVLDDVTFAWSVVDISPVTNTPNKEAPSYTDSYVTTVRPDLGQTNGTINYNMVINNPNDLNYSITVYLYSVDNNTLIDTEVITQDDQTVSWTNLTEGTYAISLQSTTVYGLSNQPEYVTLLPDIHTPSASFSAQGVGSPRPGVDGSIYTCGNIADTNGATNVTVQTSINGGNTWQSTATSDDISSSDDACHTYNVQPGTYTVKGRIEYTWDGYTHYYDLPDQTVVIGSTAWTSPVGTMTLTSTNETSPVANDGTISGSVNYSNFNNNVTFAEISVDGTNWYDINSGITGLDAGTYTVYGRFHWTDGITSADNVTNMTPVQVTVGYNNWNAPSISLQSEMDQAANPGVDGSITADVNIDTDPTGGQGDIEKYLSFSTVAGQYGTWESITSPTTKYYAPGTTVYVTGKIAYDHDNNNSTAKVEVLTQTQTITVTATPYETPNFGVSSAVTNDGTNGDITVTIRQTAGDLDALNTITIFLRDVDGNIVSSQTIDASAFTNGEATVTFTDVPNGIYYVDWSYSYNLGDGNGDITSPTNLGQSAVFNTDFTQPTIGLQPATTTPETAQSPANGTASLQYTILDPGNVLGGTDATDIVTVSLVKLNTTTGQYEDVAGTEKQLSETSTLTTATWSGLTSGQYRFRVQYDAYYTSTDLESLNYITQNGFTVGRSWNYDVSVVDQTLESDFEKVNGVNTLTPTIDPVTGEEVATLNYTLTTTNPDFLPYEVTLQLYDKNSGILLQTETITQGESTATFNNLKPGDYELRISSTGANTISGLNTSAIDFTVKTLSSAAYVSDEQIKFTKYSDTEAMFNYYLEIQNPYNKEFQFRVYMYDLTTNKIIADETVKSDGEGYISVAWAVYGIQKDHNYALVITDFEGNMVKDLQLGYRTFGDNYDNDPTGNKWWNDMETSTPWSYNYMTWGLILTVIGTGALIAGGVSYRYFYKQSKNKVAKKSKNQVK